MEELDHSEEVQQAWRGAKVQQVTPAEEARWVATDDVLQRLLKRPIGPACGGGGGLERGRRCWRSFSLQG